MISNKDYCSASRRYGSMKVEAAKARMLRTIPSARSRWREIVLQAWSLIRRLAHSFIEFTTTRNQDSQDIPLNNRPWPREGD